MALPKSDFAAFWVRQNMSLRTPIRYWLGKKMPDTMKAKMRSAKLGKRRNFSLKHRKALSDALKGRKHSWAGHNKPHSNETKQKLSMRQLNYLQNHPEERKRLTKQFMRLKIQSSSAGWDPQKMSWLERRMLKLLDETRIKGFLHNYEAEGSDGRTYYIDYAFPELMIAIECDSKAFHSTRAEKAHDAERQQFLEEEGWIFVRFTSEQILKNPEEVKKVLKEVVGKTAKARKYSLTP